jgi:hypothetical protein
MKTETSDNDNLTGITTTTMAEIKTESDINDAQVLTTARVETDDRDELIDGSSKGLAELGGPHGLIYQAAGGTGKTTILMSIQRVMADACCYYDCSRAIRDQKLQALHFFREWVSHQESLGKTTYLFDNIDGAVEDAVDTRDSYENIIFKAGFASLVDGVISRSGSSIKVICSCTDLTKISLSLTMPYRFGHPIKLESPTTLARRQLIAMLLEKYCPLPLTNAQRSKVVDVVASKSQVTI